MKNPTIKKMRAAFIESSCDAPSIAAAKADDLIRAVQRATYQEAAEAVATPGAGSGADAVAVIRALAAKVGT